MSDEEVTEIPTTEQCNSCKWARGLPHEGDEPKVPSSHWLLSRFESDDVIFEYDFWLHRANMRRKYVVCTRYPKRETMLKTSTCGEYAPEASQ